MSVLFFSCCDEKFEYFIAPFITSILLHVSHAGVEVLVPSVSDWERRNPAIVELLARHFAGKYKIGNLDDRYDGYPIKNLMAAERFLRTPEWADRHKFTYIGDIDILTFDDNVEHVHWKHAEQLGLCFSNIVRPNKVKRMSGLHFVSSRLWYNTITPEWIKGLLNELIKQKQWYSDEELLYIITERAFALPTHPIEKIATWRPVHGIHTSPAREPLGSPGWLVRGPRIEQWASLKEHPVWKAMAPAFAPEYQAVIGKLDAACATLNATQLA